MRFGVLGNRFFNSAGSYNVRMFHAEKGIFSHNDMGRCLGTKQLLTIRSKNPNANCSAGCGRPSHDIVVSDNIFRGSSPWIVQAVASNAPPEPAWGRDLIFERNFFTRDSGTVQTGLVTMNQAWENTSDVTVRNNIVHMVGWGNTGINLSNTPNASAYNNTCYSTGNPNDVVQCVWFNGSASTGTGKAYNNLFYAPNARYKTVVGGESSLPEAGGNLVATSNPFAGGSLANSLDFQLASGSPAIDRGSTLAGTQLDFLQRARPVGPRPDVGAFEYGASGYASPPPPVGTQPPNAPYLLP